MRLGKKKEKERDAEPRSQNVDGISRLICSAKAAHSAPMRGERLPGFVRWNSRGFAVFIDGMEWTGVKFFQLSATWQTHVKSFSVALVGVPLASAELNWASAEHELSTLLVIQLLYVPQWKRRNYWQYILLKAQCKETEYSDVLFLKYSYICDIYSK